MNTPREKIRMCFCVWAGDRELMQEMTQKMSCFCLFTAEASCFVLSDEKDAAGTGFK